MKLLLLLFLSSVLARSDVCRCKDGCDEEFRCLTGECLPGWSGNTCQRENVALDGQATQTQSNFDEITLCSSSESTMPCEAANAIDGIQSTTFNASTCSLPGILDDVMVWEVRFKQSVVVNWLDVYFGIDVLINQSLPTDFLVFVDKHRCYMDIVRTSSGMYSIQCPEPVQGKTLSFHAKSTIVPILSLCEIEIFRCADGWYSEFCDKRCNCYGDICDTVNGMCFYGCPNGYHGQDCLEPCSEGTWGLNCETSCENCAAGCDRFTGYCNTSDCEPFWYSGPRCDVCPPGYYGNNCTELCRNCGGNGTCGIYGMCNDGCVPRYQEPFCRECETGKWGPMCDQTCGQCVTKSCDQTSGLCDELGCRPNWKGGKCDASDVQMDTVILITTMVAFGIIIILFLALYIIYMRKRREIIKASTMDGTKNTGYDNSLDDVERGGGDDDEPDETPRTITEPTEIVCAEMKAYNERRMKSDQFYHEFMCLPTGSHGKHSYSSMKVNVSKNRFASILAFDHSRVKLHTDHQNESDYINANYIDGYEKRRYYIATQGPMPATIVDFWKMIWQEKSGKIVMLTNLVENSKIKCSQYWPSEPDTKQMWGNMQVILKDISKRNDYIIRTFELLNRKTNKERTIIQFHFTIWPDHGVPSSPASLVSFRKLIKRTPSALSGPIVVHCSAGVGRTGTFLGFDTLMEDSAENDVIDVFKYVSVMRADRPSMVQSRAQYSFLHQVIYEGILARNSLLTLDEIKQLKYRPMLVEEETVETEFKSVMLLKKEHHKINTRSAREAENIPKNRTGYIVPHDNYRAYLVTHVEGRNDYIQASLVPSLFSRDGFITTQLPMESTIIDFWRMVYEYNSLTIISLVDQESDHKIDPPFWPITGGNFKSGPFLITMTETSEPDSFYTETVVALEKTDAPDPSIRSTINIYKVHEWPVGVDVTDKRGLLALIRAIQKREEDVGHHSIVVQDIDGSTKSNLFCTIVNCINRLKEDKVLDVMLTVRDMHVVQPQCISTLPEYRFCYEMAKEYVDTLSE